MKDHLIPSDIPKGRWTRIVPIAFIMYTISYMDRNNISFGFSGIQKDLGINATYAGLAAGIFFLGSQQLLDLLFVPIIVIELETTSLFIHLPV